MFVRFKFNHMGNFNFLEIYLFKTHCVFLLLSFFIIIILWSLILFYSRLFLIYHLTLTAKLLNVLNLNLWLNHSVRVLQFIHTTDIVLPYFNSYSRVTGSSFARIMCNTNLKFKKYKQNRRIVFICFVVHVYVISHPTLSVMNRFPVNGSTLYIILRWRCFADVSQFTYTIMTIHWRSTFVRAWSL